MKRSDELSYAGRSYVAAVVLAGVFAVLHSLWTLTNTPVPWQWVMLALLTLLSGSFTVRIPGISAHLSVSDTFVFAAVLLFGPAAATMVVVLDTLVISFWLGRRSSPVSRILFNVAAPAFAIWAAANAFYLGMGIAPLSISPRPVLSVVLPLFGLATLYFLFNSWLVAFAVAFQKAESAFEIWRKNLLWLSLNYFSGASVAALLLPYLLQANTYDAFLYVTGVLLPVLLIFYLTFKAALGRVEDANRHLSQLNSLYLSTIETLAMAIDAKDQITHGHIRRVQRYAVNLAKQIGVKDEAQISAIEAASLLHDMGKLAVPEYILNKPGKLTPAEFAKMKLHASVGADILSAIDFPYPVVPIVRHHHENWDGSGYPDGLRGAAIPIGARILSVVDCFDALTSDRPYRPRLADSEAIKILLQRRGTMYDPLVVDAFLAVHSQAVASVPEPDERSSKSFRALIRGTAPSDPHGPTLILNEIAASTEETMVLYDLAIALSAISDVRGIIEQACASLRRLVPPCVCVFYHYDSTSDELIASQAVGDSATQFLGLRIHRGERLTGWVAANKQTIVNSDPVLDLGDVGRRLRPHLHSCLSTPVVAAEELVGVLTLYSISEARFGEDHRRIVEGVAKHIALPLRSAIRTLYQPDKDSPLPLQSEAFNSDFTSASDVSIIVVNVRLFAEFSTESVGVSVESVGESIRKGMRSVDLLLRHKSNQFLVLLPETNLTAAYAVAARISARLAEDLKDNPSWGQFAITVGVATAPTDGSNLESLVRSANGRERAVIDPPSQPSVH